MKIDKNTSERIKRLISDAEKGIDMDTGKVVEVYINEFNSILKILQEKGISTDICPLKYNHGEHHAYMGGLSYSGKAKIQEIITLSQNFINAPANSIIQNKKSTLLKIIILIVTSGGLWFVIQFSYSLGLKNGEKVFDSEKIKLYEENVILKQKLDSLINNHIQTSV